MAGLGPGARLSIGAGIVLLGGVFCPMLSPATVVGGAVTIELLKAFASVAAGTTANAGDVLVGKKPTDPVSLENHDLTKAVGKAIATAIRETAKDKKNQQNSKDLDKIATYTEDNWVKIAPERFTQENYSQLREANLDQLLTPEEYRLTQEGNLSVPDWENIFTDLCKSYKSSCAGQTSAVNDMYPYCIPDGDSDFQLSSDISSIAKSLHEEFPKALRETFKQDFKQDGKAFACLILNLLTGMKAEIKKQGNQQTVEFTQILAHIKKLERQLKGTNKEIKEFFTVLSKQMADDFAVVNVKLDKIDDTTDQINNKLDILLKMYEPGEQSKDLYLNHYVERPELEENVRQKIKDCLPMRIKGLKDTGKTYLLNQVIIPEAKKEGYLTVSLSLGIANTSNLDDDNKFFKWLCDSMTKELQSQIKSIENWDKESKEKLYNWKFNNNNSGQDNFKNYLQEILATIKRKGLLLALDDVDYVFEYSNLANNLGEILRYIADNTQSFQNLCLIILYSTEKYAKLSLNFSPFDGIGIPYILSDFNDDQINHLLEKYAINWGRSELEELKALVGGHPFLIKKAFADSQNQNMKPRTILDNADKNGGIYFSLFLKQLDILNLHQNELLREKFKQVVMSEEAVELDAHSIFLLQSLGLITVRGDFVTPRCELYRKYFKKELLK